MSADELAWAAALLDLPGMTPVRLTRLLDGLGPRLAWQAVRAGVHPGDPERRFRSAARGTDPRAGLARYRAAGISVLVPDGAGYPPALVGDPGAPAVLTAVGDPTVVEGRPAVAVVGTRSATPYGISVAADLGRGLAAAGVVVVSGLAIGIDAAAHVGALDAGAGAAPPVAVVGTGLDVVYPKSNRGAVGTGGPTWCGAVRGGARHPGPTPGLPRPQPHHRRSGRRRGRGGVPRSRRLVPHRGGGRPPWRPGGGGSGFGAQSGLPGHQRTARRRMCTGPGRRGRADGAVPGPGRPAGGTVGTRRPGGRAGR